MRLLRPLLLLALALLPACSNEPGGPEPVDPGAGAELGGPNQLTWYVASYTRTCTGMYEMQCMLIKDDPAEDWSNFYDQIEGFTYEPGYDYVLRVAYTDIKNPPADGPSRTYRLVLQVSKTPAAKR